MLSDLKDDPLHNARHLAPIPLGHGHRALDA